MCIWEKRCFPFFASAEYLLGKTGIAFMSTLMIAGQITGIIASLVAISRLMRAMSDADILPRRFGVLNADGTPQNAILFIIAVSCAIPFFGRTAISWPVEVSSIGAALAYGYTSAAAFRTNGHGGKFKNFWLKAAGLAGMFFAVFFFLLMVIPNYISGSVMEAPSYLLLAVWCILAFLFYRKIFKDGHKQRFGRSLIVWNALVITIIFASLMWVRQTSFENAKSTLYECVTAPPKNREAAEELIREKLGSLNVSMLCNAVIEMTLLLISLGIVYSLAFILRKRELELISEKTRMVDVSRAKSYFFSTVSHDLRTPLNAIIGFSQLLKNGFKTKDEHDQAVDAILISRKTLLKLINDVLDLSKLEASRMVIEPEPTDCCTLVREIVESFRVATKKPELDIRADLDGMPILLLVDDQKLNLMVLKAMLTKIGPFHFTMAHNGKEAMKLLNDPKDPPFDLVLTDMWMPEMDGASLVQEIRKTPNLETLPVYAITADIETAKNFSELGFSGILLKPVTMESLQETLNNAGFR